MADSIQQVADPLEMSPESFRAFCRFITGQLGIKMTEAKVPMLRSRLQRRLRVLNLPTLDTYRDFLFSDSGSDERIHFINAVTTNKTDFFREPHHFDFLTRRALPTLDPDSDAPPERRRPWSLRLWCAGCSTGEEPYSLAMTLAEYAEARPGFDFSILATDISTRVLEHALNGIYDLERIEPVAENLRKKYILRSKDPDRREIRIVPTLRRRIQFGRLNFMEDDYGVREQFDLMFFRNVMIYFDKKTQQSVVSKLCRSLASGGFLFIGHSESLAGLDLPLEPVSAAVYRRT